MQGHKEISKLSTGNRAPPFLGPYRSSSFPRVNTGVHPRVRSFVNNTHRHPRSALIEPPFHRRVITLSSELSSVALSLQQHDKLSKWKKRGSRRVSADSSKFADTNTLVILFLSILFDSKWGILTDSCKWFRKKYMERDKRMTWNGDCFILRRIVLWFSGIIIRARYYHFELGINSLRANILF